MTTNSDYPNQGIHAIYARPANMVDAVGRRLTRSQSRVAQNHPAAAAAAAATPPPTKTPPEVDLSAAFDGVAQAQIEDLEEETREVRAGPLLYSPLSLALLLACVRPEARGPTRKQLALQFGTGTDADMVLEAACKLLSDWSDQARHSSTFQSVGIVLYDEKRYVIDSTFMEKCEALMSAPLSLQQWRVANQRISTATHGLFPAELSGPPNGPFAVVNAVYFKAAWEDPFEASETRVQAFQRRINRPQQPTHSQLPLMNQRGFRQMVLHDQFDLLELPMQRDTDGSATFSMCFVLFHGEPNDTPSLYDAWPLLREANRTELTGQDVIYTIPRFTQTHEAAWTPTCLQQANFALVRSRDDPTTTKDVQASWSLLQKAIVIVDEVGAEAAAVTEMMCGAAAPMPGQKPPPPPRIFRADRPFFYFIRHQTSRVILFLGYFDGTLV